MSDSNFDNALNDCLERMAAGETLAECLARHPEHADELAPLLRMGQATMRLSQSVEPSAAGRVRGMTRLQSALSDNRHRKRRRWHLPRIYWRPISTPVAAAFAVAFLTIVAAGGTTVASADSLPGEPAVPGEERCVRTWRSGLRAQTNTRHSSTQSWRVSGGREMRELIIRGRIYEAEVVAFRLQQHLNESANRLGVVVPSHFIEMPAIKAHHRAQ